MRSVYEPSGAIQAHVLQDVLRQHGIASHVQGEHLQGAIGELPAGNLVRLLVADGDFAAARRAVEEWERAIPMDEEDLARLDRSAMATAATAPSPAPVADTAQALPVLASRDRSDQGSQNGQGGHSSAISGLPLAMAIGIAIALLAWVFL
ncbi:DUF2007 domain-containing protein [Comamonas sp. 4034]|uniref:putative signal transducing protein n=1 Tax=Comamonas sp. 4034 TaxID=3156455 RepID=UPI003D1C8033